MVNFNYCANPPLFESWMDVWVLSPLYSDFYPIFIHSLGFTQVHNYRFVILQHLRQSEIFQCCQLVFVIVLACRLLIFKVARGSPRGRLKVTIWIVKHTQFSFPRIVVQSFSCIVHSLGLRKSPSVLEQPVEPAGSASQMTEENLCVAAYRLGYQGLLINTNKYMNKSF